MEASKIWCVYSVDDNYCQHLAVSIASLLDHNQANSLEILILHLGLKEENRLKLLEVGEGYSNATIELRQLDDGWFHNLPEIGHLTIATYFRLFIHEIMPEHLEQVLYIDSDTAVVADLRELWETDLTGYAAAVVPEYWKIHHDRLGLPEDVLHFNSGVMLINLSLWRSENLLPQFLQFLTDNRSKLVNLDQDALNVVLMRRVKFVDLKWNYQVWMRFYHMSGSGLSRREFNHIAQSPSIIHFAGDKKPWRYADDARHERVYLHYVKRTPWRSFNQPGRDLKGRLLRLPKRYGRIAYKAYYNLLDELRA